MPNMIFFICLLYNEYSYLQPVLHLYTCMYMGFVPENKLIRIRIRNGRDPSFKVGICYVARMVAFAILNTESHFVLSIYKGQ